MTDQQIERALHAAANNMTDDVPGLVRGAVIEGQRRTRRRAVAGGIIGVAVVAATGVGLSSLAGSVRPGVSPSDSSSENAAITLAEEQPYAPANAVQLQVQKDGSCLVSELGAIVWPLGTYWERGAGELTAPDGTRVALSDTLTVSGVGYRLSEVPEGLLSPRGGQVLAKCVETSGTGRAFVVFDFPVQ